MWIFVHFGHMNTTLCCFIVRIAVTLGTNGGPNLRTPVLRRCLNEDRLVETGSQRDHPTPWPVSNYTAW